MGIHTRDLQIFMLNITNVYMTNRYLGILIVLIINYNIVAMWYTCTPHGYGNEHTFIVIRVHKAYGVLNDCSIDS